MANRGIQIQIHYGMLPSDLNWAHKKGDLSVAENLSRRLVSLPMYPQLTSEQVEQVVEAVNDVIG
jgi:dTDP-4-amino-4,6-dideoxygalactose transaminase